MEPDYNLIGTSIDLRQIDPISQKRLLAFFNFWLSQTVRFLNEFASRCETNLLEVDDRLRRLEVSMTLLEAKLASIPGLDADNVAPSATTAPAAPNNNEKEREQLPKAADVPAERAAVEGASSQTPNAASENEKPDVEKAVDVSKDPRYAKYFKMLQMGVPENAVKQKMELEGVDPSILQKAGQNDAQPSVQPSVSQVASTTKKPDNDDESADSFAESEESSFSD